MIITDDIICQINNANYVILNIVGFWNIHIDKNKKEIFQENCYQVNRYCDSEKAMKSGMNNFATLFYIVCQSCLTYEVLRKWNIYIDNVVLDQKTAYKF